MERKQRSLAGLNAFKVTASFLYLEHKPDLWTLRSSGIRGYPSLILFALHTFIHNYEPWWILFRPHEVFTVVRALHLEVTSSACVPASPDRTRSFLLLYKCIIKTTALTGHVKLAAYLKRRLCIDRERKANYFWFVT